MIDVIRNILFESSVGVYAPFMMGILLTISLQNFFSYLNYKDKAFIWYATYAFTILLDQIIIVFGKHTIGYFGISSNFLFSTIHPTVQWLYNAAYFIFVLEFGGIFLIAKKSAKRIKYFVYSSVLVMLLFFIIDSVTDKGLVEYVFFYGVLPIFILLAFPVYYFLFQIKSRVRYFIIPGSFIYVVFALVATLVSMFHKRGIELGWVVFYIGVFLENIFFSLGLIVKQKTILKERDQSREKLIFQLNKNEELKNNLNKKLQEEVTYKTSEIIRLNQKAESERIKQIEINYEKKLAELKVTALQSQMNPHFIFNSLNSIKLHIIKNKKEDAVYYLNKFSKLIRKILAASREKEISLQDELETAELYVNIENIRFKNEINFNLKIEKNLNLAMIKTPPLILQPFIENAIWHGLSSKKGKKKLEIEVSKKSDKYIAISISDNGIGIKNSTIIKEKKVHKKQSIGLKLTQERLQTFADKYKTDYQLRLIDLENNGKPSGTMVVIDLPLCLFTKVSV